MGATTFPGATILAWPVTLLISQKSDATFPPSEKRNSLSAPASSRPGAVPTLANAASSQACFGAPREPKMSSPFVASRPAAASTTSGNTAEAACLRKMSRLLSPPNSFQKTFFLHPSPRGLRSYPRTAELNLAGTENRAKTRAHCFVRELRLLLVA